MLVIEVSDTTLTYDPNVKARLYATHGIAEYWVVDFVGNRIWRHRQPSGTQYAERSEIQASALALPGGLGEILLTDLF